MRTAPAGKVHVEGYKDVEIRTYVGTVISLAILTGVV